MTQELEDALERAGKLINESADEKAAIQATLEKVEAERDKLLELRRESVIPIEFDDGSRWFIGSFSGGSLPPREMRLVLRSSDGTETVYRYVAEEAI